MIRTIGHYCSLAGLPGDNLRLADFIEMNAEPILVEWARFAETCSPAGATMDLVALRDHALEMLQSITADLRTSQTDLEQEDKSKGNAERPEGAPDTPAEVHGAGRAESGFTVGEMVSEYRALRASVIRLWTQEVGSLARSDIDDLMRFNEAIDQALAESITRYADDVNQSKEMFLAILGHDLRTPLSAVISASEFMIETGDLEEPHLTLTTRIVRSSKRMNRMVGDLLEFTRSRMGSGVPIVRAEMNLATEAANAVAELSAAHPNRVIQLDTSGDLRGNWDCGRIAQLLANLLGNAVQHGSADTTITVTIQGGVDEIVLRVHNYGPSIPTTDLAGLFRPFKRLQSSATLSSTSTSFGLGLYIAERVIAAHGGTIGVTSSDDAGTAFVVHLPR